MVGDCHKESDGLQLFARFRDYPYRRDTSEHDLLNPAFPKMAKLHARINKRVFGAKPVSKFTLRWGGYGL